MKWLFELNGCWTQVSYTNLLIQDLYFFQALISNSFLWHITEYDKYYFSLKIYCSYLLIIIFPVSDFLYFVWYKRCFGNNSNNEFIININILNQPNGYLNFFQTLVFICMSQYTCNNHPIDLTSKTISTSIFL